MMIYIILCFVLVLLSTIWVLETHVKDAIKKLNDCKYKLNDALVLIDKKNKVIDELNRVAKSNDALDKVHESISTINIASKEVFKNTGFIDPEVDEPKYIRFDCFGGLFYLNSDRKAVYVDEKGKDI